MFPIVLTSILGVLALCTVAFLALVPDSCDHADCVPLQYGTIPGDGEEEIIVLIDECVRCHTPIARTS